MFLSWGCAVNELDSGGASPLIYATENGDEVMLILLIRGGADVNIVDRLGRTPLWRAITLICCDNWASQEAINIAELLVKNGANVRATNPEGCDPLMKIIEHSPSGLQKEASSLIELVIEKGADIHSARSCGRNPLLAAAFAGKIAFVRLLLSHGADLICHESLPIGALSVREPFMLRENSSIHESLQLLIGRGINVNIRFANGANLLHLAVAVGDFGAMGLLLSHGVELKVKKECGDALLLSLICRPNPSPCNFHTFNTVVKLLLNQGASITRHSQEERPLIMRAALFGSATAVEALIQQGHDVNKTETGGAGETALNIACGLGSLEMASLLLDAGAFVDVQDIDGYTALRSAVRKLRPDIVGLLLSRGANVFHWSVDAELRKLRDTPLSNTVIKMVEEERSKRQW